MGSLVFPKGVIQACLQLIINRTTQANMKEEIEFCLKRKATQAGPKTLIILILQSEVVEQQAINNQALWVMT